MTYSTSKASAANLVTVDASRVFEVIALNKKGIKPGKLEVLDDQEPVKKDFEDVVGQDSLTRFDKSKKRTGNNGGNGQNRRRKKSGFKKNNGNDFSGAAAGSEAASSQNGVRGNNNRNGSNNNGKNNNNNRTGSVPE